MKKKVETGKIRIPSTSVELVQILGMILRDHLKLKLWGTECWTFEQVSAYDVKSKDNIDPETDIYRGVEHEVNVYLGEGYFRARHFTPNTPDTEKVQARVRCELSKWVPASLSVWIFHIWLKAENGEIRRYYFECHRGYGSGRNINLDEKKEIPLLPPKRIAF
jgi:hypothetical protein